MNEKRWMKKNNDDEWNDEKRGLDGKNGQRLDLVWGHLSFRKKWFSMKLPVQETGEVERSSKLTLHIRINTTGDKRPRNYATAV